MVVGGLASWIGSFFTYGFGELIEKTTEIANNTSKNPQRSNDPKVNGVSSKTSQYSKEDLIDGFGELFK
jgi:hypothetical protein